MLAAPSVLFPFSSSKSSPVPKAPSPIFPGDFGTRDPSDKVSRVFLFFLFTSKLFFSACVSEEKSLLTLSISQHEISGHRGQRSRRPQSTPCGSLSGIARVPGDFLAGIARVVRGCFQELFPSRECRDKIHTRITLRPECAVGCVTTSHCHVLF